MNIGSFYEAYGGRLCGQMPAGGGMWNLGQLLAPPYGDGGCVAASWSKLTDSVRPWARARARAWGLTPKSGLRVHMTRVTPWEWFFMLGAVVMGAGET